MYLASWNAGLSLSEHHSQGSGLAWWQGAGGKASEPLQPLSLSSRNYGTIAAPSQPPCSNTCLKVQGARLITVALLLAVNSDVAGRATPVGSQGAQVLWGDVVQLLILVCVLVIILVILLACSATSAMSQLIASSSSVASSLYSSFFVVHHACSATSPTPQLPASTHGH